MPVRIPVFAPYFVVRDFENTHLLACKLRFSQSRTPRLAQTQAFSINIIVRNFENTRLLACKFRFSQSRTSCLAQTQSFSMSDEMVVF